MSNLSYTQVCIYPLASGTPCASISKLIDKQISMERIEETFQCKDGVELSALEYEIADFIQEKLLDDYKDGDKCTVLLSIVRTRKK